MAQNNSKYLRTLIGIEGIPITTDVYRVLRAFKVISPPLQHLIKKALCVGLRGHKDMRQDLIDIRDSAEEALAMYEEEHSLNEQQSNESK